MIMEKNTNNKKKKKEKKKTKSNHPRNQIMKLMIEFDELNQKFREMKYQ